MKLKDVVKIIVFSIIGFVLTMGLGYATGMLGIAPSLYISCAFATIIGAPVFVILSRSVGKRGVAFSYFFLIGVYYTLLMGMWPILIINTIAGVLSELVMGGEVNYKANNKRAGYAYGLGMFIYSFHAMVITYFFGTNPAIVKMMSPEYISFLKNFYTPINIGICALISVIASLIGASFGNYIYGKFFSSKTKESNL
ncbi:MAG: MptD family putative ECF transporter S component [Tissierellia bacterium]|nr:MptD family putative ECF transporter S component [Tissierellia bacterium]